MTDDAPDITKENMDAIHQRDRDELMDMEDGHDCSEQTCGKFRHPTARELEKELENEK